MPNQLITVATFSQPMEAHVLKGRLEAEGITAYLLDENIVSINILYSNAVGGVKVQVDEADVEAALKIVGELPPLELVPPPDAEPDSQEPACAKCGSREYLRERHLGLLALQILTLGFAFGGRPRWKCAKCGHPAGR